MLKKFKEIIFAWIAAADPTEKEKELALYRRTVCSDCEYRKRKLFAQYCSLCWCPLSKKVYSKTKDSCQKNKWKW